MARAVTSGTGFYPERDGYRKGMSTVVPRFVSSRIPNVPARATSQTSPSTFWRRTRVTASNSNEHRKNKAYQILVFGTDGLTPCTSCGAVFVATPPAWPPVPRGSAGKVGKLAIQSQDDPICRPARRSPEQQPADSAFQLLDYLRNLCRFLSLPRHRNNSQSSSRLRSPCCFAGS